MKEKIFYLFAGIIISVSCNNTQTTSTQQQVQDTATKPKPPVNFTGQYCYSYIQNKDSVTLRIVVSDSSVTGKLMYNFFEKDDNDGVIQGSLRNDTLIANYTFTSEGKESVRQVAFLLSDSSAKEGYGNMVQQDTVMRFSNPDSLSFNNSLVLKKQSCP